MGQLADIHGIAPDEQPLFGHLHLAAPDAGQDADGLLHPFGAVVAVESRQLKGLCVFHIHHLMASLPARLLEYPFQIFPDLLRRRLSLGFPDDLAHEKSHDTGLARPVLRHLGLAPRQYGMDGRP